MAPMQPMVVATSLHALCDGGGVGQVCGMQGGLRLPTPQLVPAPRNKARASLRLCRTMWKMWDCICRGKHCPQRREGSSSRIMSQNGSFDRATMDECNSWNCLLLKLVCGAAARSSGLAAGSTTTTSESARVCCTAPFHNRCAEAAYPSTSSYSTRLARWSNFCRLEACLVTTLAGLVSPGVQTPGSHNLLYPQHVTIELRELPQTLECTHPHGCCGD